MKNTVYAITAAVALVLGHQATCAPQLNNDVFFDLFSLSASTTWHEYPVSMPDLTFQKEKWAWTYSFVIKSKQPLKLKHLILQWNGSPINTLSASLYQKKERDELLLPIESNFVCDGVWNARKQQLSFPLNQKVIAVNKYHLMLSYPKGDEKKLKQGRFVVASTLIKAMNQNKHLAHHTPS